MTKNNSKNWLEIEEEFRKKFPFAIINWSEGEKATDKMKEILAFFKPYFQERLHEEAVEELEKVCPDHDTKSICIKCMKVVLTSVDNNLKE